MKLDFRYTYDDLLQREKRAIDIAEMAMDNAYQPYSSFSVGACLVTEDDEYIYASNVENSSYGLTICAERSAIVKANSEGIRRFKAIAVITRGEDFDSQKPGAPCGACRQVINEFAQLSTIGNIEIILSNTQKNEIAITSINELLPMAFGPKDLNIDIEKYR
ncbi:MAG: cytidine deaminase [Candidatus Spechtbacterales bacterium]|nr:cytidine deaminase [Candidatus Spechtbacterales bacterium]